MSASIQPPPLTGPQMVAATTVVALTVTAFSAALWGNAEQSKRGFRLLDWLDSHRRTELPPAEADL
ncbi:hypothetical protein [Streptomyces abyssomicinicus]|uniref:hypothetical protein n=1 Tax=Streptomyces abyssomicinicus TaxID=574929 RepID=UPI0012506F75|nr:hypothetical protein [Streptomyces abyssomicinicus]